MEIDRAPRFEVMRASAGSGKTFSLVQQYLSFCLAADSDTYFKHILALTFTNKAADEMKHRVLGAIKELSEGKGGHFETLQEQLSLSESELKDKAARVYLEMLTNYGSLSILTIDKFVNRLVRGFSRELTLDGDFRLAMDQERLVGDAVDDLLSRVGDEDPELTKIMEEYALQRVEDEENWKMRADLVNFGKLLFKEETRPVLAALTELSPSDFLEIRKRYDQEINVARRLVREPLKSALDACEQQGIGASDFTNSNAFNYFTKFLKGEESPPSNALRVILEGDTGKPLYAKSKMKAYPEKAAIMDDLHPLFTKGYEAIVAYLESPNGRILQLKKVLLKTLYPLAVLQQLNASLEQVRKEQNSFTFSDLNHQLEQLVNVGPAPFIYERVGERYHHFFIDEFQDTSVVQWQNFLPLIENSLANGYANLIVGDGKQAIYRWRNGDVRQLQQLPKLLSRNDHPEQNDWQAALERAYHESFLDKNWRSKENIVSFNNRLFESLQTELSDEHRSIYKHHQQEPKAGEGGWVTVEAFKPPSNQELAGDPDGEKYEERHTRILHWIHKNLEEGRSLSDITILVRNRKHGAALSRFLLRKDINTVTEESLKIGKHVAPLSVIYLLQSLLDPQDQGNKVRFLQCFLAYHPELDPTSIFGQYIDLPEDRKGRSAYDLNAFLKDQFEWEDPESLLKLDLYSAIQSILKKLGVLEKYPSYAEALLQLSLQYQIEESGGISGFLEFWEDEAKDKSITIPPNANGVKVMTIHKSKGLQFKVVIALVTVPHKGGHQDLELVELDPEIFNIGVGLATLSGMKDTWAHDQYMMERSTQLLDELNVYYVSLTRAEEHLHVILESAKEPSRGSDPNIGHYFAQHLQDGFEKDIYEEVVEMGHPVKEVEIQESEVAPVFLDKLEYLDPEGRLKVSVDNPFLRSESDTLTPRALGEEIHRMLSLVNEESDVAALSTLATPWQRMSEEEWGTLIQSVQDILADPQVKGWFNHFEEAHNERELLTADGAVMRPDRMVLKDGVWNVIDYKTGAQEEKHISQVEQYVEQLKSMTSQQVEGYLLYTDSKTVVAV